MTRNFLQRRHNQPQANPRNQSPRDGRIEASIVLREIAFALAMTRKVRAEMEAEEEAPEPALV